MIIYVACHFELFVTCVCYKHKTSYVSATSYRTDHLFMILTVPHFICIKIFRFLWTLYVNNNSDNGMYIYKWDFTSALHLENTSLTISASNKSAEILTSLFGPNDRVTFEQFRSWLLIHKEATVLSKWLLSGKANAVQELDTPTFYQSLAGVTHLEERVSTINMFLFLLFTVPYLERDKR